MVVLVLFVLSVAACDVHQGSPIYNNPPPGPSNLPTGQSHTSCPGGYTFC
jgi:hypothetical protein